MSGRLRWKKNPRETGLRSIGAGPRGSVLSDGETELASVAASGGGMYGPVRGWFWVTYGDSPAGYVNTHATPCADESAAKKACLAYLRPFIEAAKSAEPQP